MANKLENGKGEDAGSDKATCMMLGSQKYPNNGEGKVITEPGDFSKTGVKISCPINCIEKTDNKMNVFGPAELIDDKSPRI